MKELTIREILGDYALDLELDNGHTFTFYFNSRQNALTVKRIIEVDMSVPNAATVCDMQEVVRCKDCIHSVENWQHDELDCTDYTDITCDYFMTDGMEANDFCSYGERKDGEGG